jgi:uncharacterized protein YjiS (DUF1127 family)
MTWFAAPLAPSLRLVFAGSARGLLRQVATIATAIKHRRAVMNLDELDDRALTDIGLVRADVDSALSEPFFRDPSMVLVRSMARCPGPRQKSDERRIRPVVPVVRDGRTPKASRRA